MNNSVISKSSKRATLYIKPDLHKTLKLKSVETSQTMSDIVNQALQDSFFEDLDDIKTCEKRKNEDTISYEENVKKAKVEFKLNARV